MSLLHITLSLLAGALAFVLLGQLFSLIGSLVLWLTGDRETSFIARAVIGFCAAAISGCLLFGIFALGNLIVCMCFGGPL